MDDQHTPGYRGRSRNQRKADNPPMTRTRAVTAGVLATVLVLAGCTRGPGTEATTTAPAGTATTGTAPATPRPTATTEAATPDPETPDSQPALNDNAAIQAFVDYMDLDDEVGHGYYDRDGVEKLKQLTTGDYDRWSSLELMHEQHAHKIGSSALSDFVVVGHESSEEGMSSVIFEVCIDSRGVDIIRPDGSSLLVPVPDSEKKVVSTITMWFRGPRQGGEPAWRVAGFETDRERPC